MEILQAAAKVSVLIFVVSSMLAMGLGLSFGQIVTPLRDIRLVSLAILMNFVLMPLTTILLWKLLQLDEPLGIGLLLLGTAAGAPFLPKLAEVAKGDLAYAVGIMVLLMVVTVCYLPLVLPVLLTGVSVNPAKIATSLVILMLIPLGTGLVLKARYENVALRLKPIFDKISSLGLILLVLLISLVNIKNLLSVFGTRGILAGILFVLFGFGLGWFFGGPTTDIRKVSALATGQRNIAAALVVGGQSFNDPRVVVMIVVVAIVGLFILMPLARLLGKRARGSVN